MEDEVGHCFTGLENDPRGREGCLRGFCRVGRDGYEKCSCMKDERVMKLGPTFLALYATITYPTQLV